jgi:uncharacterized cupin superfamily protein
MQTAPCAERTGMQKVNAAQINWQPHGSPSKKFFRDEKKISEALGRKPKSMDLLERHPFDVELARVPSGSALCPYHSHSAQWELYYVVSGSGVVRHRDGKTEVVTGDAFLFKPNEPHQIININNQDLMLFIVADNPVGESCHYPDSTKWAVKSPEYRIMRSEALDYYDGEDT